MKTKEVKRSSLTTSFWQILFSKKCVTCVLFFLFVKYFSRVSGRINSRECFHPLLAAACRKAAIVKKRRGLCPSILSLSAKKLADYAPPHLDYWVHRVRPLQGSSVSSYGWNPRGRSKGQIGDVYPAAGTGYFWPLASHEHRPPARSENRRGKHSSLDTRSGRHGERSARALDPRTFRVRHRGVCQSQLRCDPWGAS